MFFSIVRLGQFANSPPSVVKILNYCVRCVSARTPAWSVCTGWCRWPTGGAGVEWFFRTKFGPMLCCTKLLLFFEVQGRYLQICNNKYSILRSLWFLKMNWNLIHKTITNVSIYEIANKWKSLHPKVGGSHLPHPLRTGRGVCRSPRLHPVPPQVLSSRQGEGRGTHTRILGSIPTV